MSQVGGDEDGNDRFRALKCLNIRTMFLGLMVVGLTDRAFMLPDLVTATPDTESDFMRRKALLATATQ